MSFPMCNISQLKKHVGPSVSIQQLPECMTDDGELEVQLLKILQHRYSSKGELEILVQWKGLPECENSWEPFTSFHSLFPYFHLEDNVPLDERGNVRINVYVTNRKRHSQLGEKQVTQAAVNLDQEASKERLICGRELVRMEGGDKKEESREEVGQKENSERK